MFHFKEDKMAEFIGLGPHYCKNCGGMEGLHRGTDMACPNRGEDQTGLKPEIFLNTKFEPQDYLGKKVETLEGRTLFDDYFLAAIQGISTAFAHINTEMSVEEYKELPGVFTKCAYDMAIVALEKRADHFAEERKAE
jgi:hypothetical protein